VISLQHIRPGLRTCVPLDLYDTSDTGALAEFFNKCKDERQQLNEEDAGEEEE
jgi:hypothetical protein